MSFLIEVHLEYLSFEVKWSLMLQRFYIGSAKGNKETKKMPITVVLAATNKLSAVVVFWRCYKSMTRQQQKIRHTPELETFIQGKFEINKR